MFENPPVICNAETPRKASRYRSFPWKLVITFLAIVTSLSVAGGQQLPPGGTTSWEIHGPEEIVTFVLFAPGKTVVHAVVIAGSSARHQACSANWSKKGNHPLARGAFVGPTFFTTYDVPLKGSAYVLRE